MAQYAMGIDIGTTGVKAVLVSGEGELIAQETVGHDLLSLRPGWAEEDAGIWWANAAAAVSRLTVAHPDKARDLRGIGVSGMVPALVLLDGEGQVLRNTIQQNDARAVEQLERLKGELDQGELYRRTGGYTNAQHVLPRLLWVKDNEPEVFARTRTVMGSYDYITYRLTGSRQVELNWAAESGLYDIREHSWIREYMEPFGVDPALFPPAAASGEVVGVTRGMEEAMGLPGRGSCSSSLAERGISSIAPTGRTLTPSSFLTITSSRTAISSTAAWRPAAPWSSG